MNNLLTFQVASEIARTAEKTKRYEIQTLMIMDIKLDTQVGNG